MSKNRMDKDELNESDEFITVSSKVLEYVMKNKTQIASASVAFLVAIFAVSSWFQFQDNKENKASLLFGKANVKLEKVLADNDKDSLDAVEKEFQNLLEEYSGTDSASYAKVSFARLALFKKDFQTAISYYEDALKELKSDPYTKNIILCNLGTICEQKDDIDKAISYFEKVTASGEAVMTDEAYYHLGLLYKEKGVEDKSREAFSKILESESDSTYKEIVKEMIAVN
jgi:predicted negative regulator of RcsB-dependent stress response